MLVRRAIVAHMRSLGQVLWEHHIYPDVAYRNGMEHYISETCMERSGAWGTQVEIIALANLLNTPIYTYTMSAWVKYGPQAAYGCLGLSQSSVDEMAIYIGHHGDHYDVVTSVELS